MLHEILHCLGVGTLWSEGVHHEGTTYIGANGVQAWNDMGCTGPLPMANDLAHWNDDCFNTEGKLFLWTLPYIHLEYLISFVPFQLGRII